MYDRDSETYLIGAFSKRAMQYIFWFSIFMIFYAYFGYPLCLFVISVFKRRSNLNTYEVASEDYKPSVTFIITVFNEESRIREKIEGTLSQDYPKNLKSS